MRKAVFTLVSLASLLVLVSCATTNYAYRQARFAEQRGNWDEAVVFFYQALERSPGNVDIRLRLEVSKRMASRRHLLQARALWEEKQYEDAFLEFRTAVELDPLNRQAWFEFNQNIEELDRMQAEARKKEEWEKLKEAEHAELEKLANGRPVIDINSKQTQSFVFHNREIGDIYQALAKLAGINIIFHDTVRQRMRQKTNFIINNATFWDAFDYFVTSNNHFYRMINSDSIMIIDGSPANRRNYQDLAIKVFFLSNADVREVFSTLRTLFQGIRLQQNRQQNAVIVRDTPQKLVLIARIIDIIDKPKAEVIIDVEFLEVDSTLLHDVGVLLSNYAVNKSFINPGVSEGPKSIIRLDDWKLINKTNIFLTIPSVAYHFLRTNARSRLLAKPQLRITDGEKSQLHIGERVPVRKTTFNPNQAAGIGIPVDSFEYEEIGIKFTITPHVHHNHEISLDLDIDISAIGAGATSTNPTFTTRNIKTKIRLRDGETNLLAGLIREEEKLNVQGIAGLADIPVIGRLFSKTSLDKKKTDIIITITPHIVRSSLITLDDLRALMVGPDSNLGFLGTMSMEELEDLRVLRGVPVKGRSERFRFDYSEEGDEYYEEDEGRPREK